LKSSTLLKTVFVLLLTGALFAGFHAPTRKKLIKHLPEAMTSSFSDDPSDKLPKDLVLGLTDTYDLGFHLYPLEAEAESLSSSQLKGKIVMVLIWNTDCGSHCLATMKSMERLAERYAGKDVLALTINNDSLTVGQDVAGVRKYMADNDIQLPVLTMDLPTGQQFWPTECVHGLAKQPFHELLVYDRNGAVRYRANENYLRPVVQELLFGGYDNYKEEKVKEGTNPPLVINE
jgi:thiol-disulfide isomerase/thioredoxin